MVPPKKLRNYVSDRWCLPTNCGTMFLINGVSTEAAESCFWPMVPRRRCPNSVHGWSCLGRPCTCLFEEGFRPRRRSAFTGFWEWLRPNRIKMEDGLGGCPVVWGAGRGCLRALRAPRRFAGSHAGWILLDLRCLWSLGWGSRRWSAFGRDVWVCVGPTSHN